MRFLYHGVRAALFRSGRGEIQLDLRLNVKGLSFKGRGGTMARKPVLFIPGFPASELIQTSTDRIIFPPSTGDLLDPQRRQEIVDLLVGPDDPPGDVVAGEPIRDLLGIAKQAQSLYDILRNRYGYTTSSGDNFRPLGWDWR